MSNLRQLRARAIGQTLFAHTSLGNALERLAFVQADPIRAPARAQDLILRHRVHGYRVGDLERWYPTASAEEGVLYAYGFLPRENWNLLRPRKTRTLTSLQRDVLAAVHERGPLMAKELDAQFGRMRVENAWGGTSRATKSVLETLHRAGLLRIAGRTKGIRRYATAPAVVDEQTPEQRFDSLVMIAATVLAPVLEKRLRSIAAGLRQRVPEVNKHIVHIKSLCQRGVLVRAEVDGVVYLMPSGSCRPADETTQVRFLAPFDPLVWDRDRFEQLWGWTYRFEAYTPKAKRIRGYYAMPMLYGLDVIGWANVSNAPRTGPTVELGFVNGRPQEPEFGTALDEEIERLRTFFSSSAHCSSAHCSSAH